MILIIYVTISITILIISYSLANKLKKSGLASFLLAVTFAFLGGIYLSIGNQNLDYLINLGLYKDSLNVVNYFTLFMIISLIFISIYKLAMKK